jgi:serine/threonine protein kinase
VTHPTDAQLKRWLADDLPADERARIDEHVNNCEHCLQVLDALQRPQQSELRLLADLIVSPPPAVALNGEPHRAAAVPNGHAEHAVADQPWPRFVGYELLERAARGGMGEVFKARHVRTSRVVALKTLPATNAGGADYAERLARFAIEAEAVSRLRHPNIVSIYDVGEQDGQPYFTMEWLEGGNLAEKLQGVPQGEQMAVDCVSALARALQHAHDRGVIHRDIKPSNILLEAARTERTDGRELPPALMSRSSLPAAKIADFGVAKLLDRGGMPTKPCQWLGTPEYMAPEQASERSESRHIGPRTDVYSLGVILYEILTGRPPFRADEPLETLRQVSDDEPVPPRRLRPRLDHDLETICLKCLQKDGSRRYDSARALADDLDRWRAGQPILARPATPWQRASKWARRHPERALLLALPVCLLLGLAAGLVWQWAASQSAYTRQLAVSAEHQFMLVRYAVAQASRDPALRTLLDRPQVDRGPLARHLETTRREFARWFTRPGENPPIINWFVMEPGGTILSDSYEDPRSVGINYAFRDYFHGLTGAEAPVDPAAVYVSRVYESEQDQRFKLTVISRIWQDNRLLGLLGASLAVDSRMVALDMTSEWPGARLVGPFDHGARAPDEGAAARRPDYVTVLDRRYDVPGQQPRPVDADMLATLKTFAAQPDLRHATDWLSASGSMINYARIGDTHYVAVLERPYPAPVRLVARHPLVAAATIAAVVAVLGIVRRVHRRPRDRSPGLEIVGRLS